MYQTLSQYPILIFEFLFFMWELFLSIVSFQQKIPSSTLLRVRGTLVLSTKTCLK